MYIAQFCQCREALNRISKFEIKKQDMQDRKRQDRQDRNKIINRI